MKRLASFRSVPSGGSPTGPSDILLGLAAIFASTSLCVAQDDPADLGAIVINEIHYHPDEETEFVEFIELYNRGGEAVDLSGWTFSNGIEYVFPVGSTLEPGAYLVLAQDETAYNRKFGSIFTGGVKAAGQWDLGTLSNDGETLTLRDAAGVVVDRVDYQDSFPWPVSADGGGASMELLSTEIDNDLSGHWRASLEKPTPGKPNSQAAELAEVPPAVRKVSHSPQAPTSQDVVVVQAKVTDADGIASVSLELQVVTPGNYIRVSFAEYEASWEAMPMNDEGTDGDAEAGDEIYSATVPAESLSHRHLIRYRIVAVDSLGNSVQLPYADDPTPNRALFVYDGVPEWSGSASGKPPRRTFTNEEMTLLPVYHLIADADDVERCQYNRSSENTRFSGTMVYDGRVYDHIEFRVRGEFSTYQSGKNKWKFFFNRGNDFRARDNYGRLYEGGFRVMNFSACASPWVPANRGMSGLDESTGFRLHALAGVPTPRTHHVHFRIIDEVEESPSGDQYGGDLWGLYLSQEHPDGRFLSRRGLPDGNTFKIESGSGDQKHQGPFESNYSGFVSDARRRQTHEWWHANMNMSAYYSFRAINRAVGNIDIREGWNHYFYQHPGGQWYPIPWDLDMTFMPETHWSGVIDAKACLQTSEIAVEYSNRCRELLDLLLGDRSAGGGQVGSVVEEIAQWVGSPKAWTDVVSLEKVAGSKALATTEVPHGYATGDLVSIVGVQTTGYEGDHEIEVVSETQFTYKVSIFATSNISGDAILAGKSVGKGSAWSEIDMAMWNAHSRTTGGHQGNFYANPTTQNFRGGTLTRTLTSADVGGFAEYLKAFTTDTDPDDFAIGDGDQRGYGYNYVELEGDDGNAPHRPTLTYTGEDGFPVDSLSFRSGAFSGGTLFQKQEFAGMEWRLGEIYNPSTPNYVEGTPWRYEITPVWESGLVEAFEESMNLPTEWVRPGSTYRVRVRHLNQLGGWSRWSEAIEFVADEADLSGYGTLAITEIMYHPAEPSAAEQEAGFEQEDFEYIELHNRGGEAVDLAALRFTKGIDFDFDTGEVLVLEPGAYLVVVANREAFLERYGEDGQSPAAIAGEYRGRLANGGERVKLSFGAGQGLLDFSYDDEEAGGWPTASDGEGASLQLRDPSLRDTEGLSNPDNWVAGSLGGTPGRAGGQVPPPPMGGDDSDGDGVIDELEALAGTDAHDPTDFFRILSVVRDGGTVGLRWASVSGKAYAVQYASELTGDEGAWETIGEVTASDGETGFDDEGRVAGAGYYRVRVQ